MLRLPPAVAGAVGAIMSPANAKRAKLFRAVHAEAARRKIDHDALHDICRHRFGVSSMGDLSEGQLESIYRSWTGHGIRTRPLPRRGYGRSAEAEMVSAEDLETLGRAFARRNWGDEAQRTFIRRQLHGRDQIRTKRDFWKVFSGVRAMNRREGL
ncbi:MAG: hypothetical protein ABFD86_05075 [Bryobacteraceae bacterium]